MKKDWVFLITLLGLTYASGALGQLTIPKSSSHETYQHEQISSDQSSDQKSIQSVQSTSGKSGTDSDNHKESKSNATQSSNLPAMFDGIKITDVLISAATIALAFLAYFQWKAMDAQRRAMHRQTVHMKRGLILNENAAQIAKAALYKERARIRFFCAYIADYRIEIDLFNAAETGAKNVKIRWGILLLNKPVGQGNSIELVRYNQCDNVFIDPQSHFEARDTTERFDSLDGIALAGADIYVYAVGQIEYWDMFEGTPTHTTRFCRRLTGFSSDGMGTGGRFGLQSERIPEYEYED